MHPTIPLAARKVEGEYKHLELVVEDRPPAVMLLLWQRQHLLQPRLKGNTAPAWFDGSGAGEGRRWDGRSMLVHSTVHDVHPTRN